MLLFSFSGDMLAGEEIPQIPLTKFAYSAEAHTLSLTIPTLASCEPAAGRLDIEPNPFVASAELRLTEGGGAVVTLKLSEYAKTYRVEARHDVFSPQRIGKMFPRIAMLTVRFNYAEESADFEWVAFCPDAVERGGKTG